jgi:hypothetical protein
MEYHGNLSVQHERQRFLLRLAATAKSGSKGTIAVSAPQECGASGINPLVMNSAVST